MQKQSGGIHKDNKRRLIILLLGLLLIAGRPEFYAMATDEEPSSAPAPAAAAEEPAPAAGDTDSEPASASASGEAASAPSAGENAPDPAAEEAVFASADGSRTVLTFTSDIHNTANNIAANRLDAWLDRIEDKYGHIDVMSFCGDMGAAQAKENEFWTYTSSVMDVVDGERIRGIYTTGNHEFYNGKFDTTENTVKNKYIAGQQALEGDNFIIYCLGTANWDNRRDTYTDAQITALETFLNGLAAAGNSKPVIILTHFPLHCYRSGRMTRQTVNADKVIGVLNAAVNNKGQKIVLLWGHNHTVSDTYYDGIYKGETIEYADGSSKKFEFYYAAAGCMSDSEYGTGSAFVKGKGLVITVNSDNKLTFAYYDAYGNNVTEGGTYSEYDNPAEGLVIEGPDGQPVTDGQTVAAGRKLQLHASTVPADAVFTRLRWSSSNTDIATVSETGLVRGISEGKVTITAAIPADVTGAAVGTAGQTSAVKASIEVTVGPEVQKSVYVLTDSLVPGCEYLIASSKTGSAYALMNDEGTPGAAGVKIDGDRIVTNDDSIAFTAEGSGGTVSALRNGGLALSAGRNGLSFNAYVQGERPWSYSSDGDLINTSSMGSRRTEYRLYYDITNGRFTAAAANTLTDDTPVYLFVKTKTDPEPQPDPKPDPEPDTQPDTQPGQTPGSGDQAAANTDSNGGDTHGGRAEVRRAKTGDRGLTSSLLMFIGAAAALAAMLKARFSGRKGR